MSHLRYLAPGALLSPTQERLLRALVAKPGEIVPWDVLVAKVGTASVSALRHHVKAVRRCLAPGVFITCQKDLGYALIAAPDGIACPSPRKRQRATHGGPYTADEDAYIRDNWTCTSDYAMAAVLGRPVKSVAQRRSTILGLHRFQPVVAPAPPKGITREAIAWAIANFRTNPEARVIAAMVAGER